MAEELDPTPDTPLTLEDRRYLGRKHIAFGAFYFMIACTTAMLLYGMFWPGGPEVLVQMTGLITMLYGSFTVIVGGYLSLDAYELHSTHKKEVELAP